MEDTQVSTEPLNTVSTDPLSIKETARKQLKEIINTTKYDKKMCSLREYLTIKRSTDTSLDQLITDAQLEEKSANSILQLMDAKDFEEEPNEDFNKIDEFKIEENTISTKNKTSSEGDNSDKKEDKKE